MLDDTIGTKIYSGKLVMYSRHATGVSFIKHLQCKKKNQKFSFETVLTDHRGFARMKVRGQTPQRVQRSTQSLNLVRWNCEGVSKLLLSSGVGTRRCRHANPNGNFDDVPLRGRSVLRCSRISTRSYRAWPSKRWRIYFYS